MERDLLAVDTSSAVALGDERVVRDGEILANRKRGRPKGSPNKKKKAEETPNVIIPYKPREWAKLFHRTDKKNIVLVLHRRAGKTTAVLNHLIRDAMNRSFTRYAFIAPTYKQAKNIAWDLLKFYARPIPGVEFNINELTVTFPNGSKIQLFGAENADALRGIGLHGVCFDEYSQQPSNIYSEVVSKCLADTDGYSIWIGTPQGKNEFYRVYRQGITDTEHWFALLQTIDTTLDTESPKDENIQNLKTYLEREKRQVRQGLISEDEFLQEWYCSFDASVKGAYYASELAKLFADKRSREHLFDSLLQVHTVWDIGVGDKTAIGFYQKAHNEIRMIDYYENEGEGLTHYIKVLQEKQQKLGYVYGKHYAPHDIAVREFSTGKSRLEIAAELGINFEIVPKLDLEDGINAGRAAFHRLWVDSEKCFYWLDAMAQYTKEWDDKKGVFKNKPLHNWTSHPADVHRYMAIVEKEMASTHDVFEQYRVEATRNKKANSYE